MTDYLSPIQETFKEEIPSWLKLHCKGEGLKETIEDARLEDRNHFEALIPRIDELGGEIPRDIRNFAT